MQSAEVLETDQKIERKTEFFCGFCHCNWPKFLMFECRETMAKLMREQLDIKVTMKLCKGLDGCASLVSVIYGNYAIN